MTKGVLTNNKPEEDIYKTFDEMFKGLNHDEISRVIKKASEYLNGDGNQNKRGK